MGKKLFTILRWKILFKILLTLWLWYWTRYGTTRGRHVTKRWTRHATTQILLLQRRRMSHPSRRVNGSNRLLARNGEISFRIWVPTFSNDQRYRPVIEQSNILIAYHTHHYIGTFLTVFSLNNWTVLQEKIQYYLEMGLDARKPVVGVCNNKFADQPAHPRSLINAFVILILESVIYKIARSNILIF